MAIEKYFVYKLGILRPICGIKYDEDNRTLVIGGPQGNIDEIENIITLMSGSVNGLKADGIRLRYTFKNVRRAYWSIFLKAVKVSYICKETKSFRRLMS